MMGNTRLKFCSLWCVMVILGFLTGYTSTNDDLENLIKGDVYYHRMVWDPTGRTVSVFNVSNSSPLHVILIRKNIGNCEMFFLRLKDIINRTSIIACIGELSATRFEQKCNWVNNSEAINVNEGNIYGMPNDCGPWYMTIYVSASSNTTELSLEVSEPYDPIAFRWFRVLTNLAFMPAIIIALKRRYYAEAIIYTLTFLLSGMYHLCEAELHCFKGHSRLHYSDYFASDLSIITTIWCMTRIEPPKKHLMYLTIAILLQFAVTETFKSSYHFYINLIFAGPALVYVCFQYVYRTLKYRSVYPSTRRWIFNLIPGYSLATTGAVVNLVLSDPENYYYVHCIWHITIMLSVAFLLPVPTDEDKDELWWIDKFDKDSYTPLI